MVTKHEVVASLREFDDYSPTMRSGPLTPLIEMLDCEIKNSELPQQVENELLKPQREDTVRSGGQDVEMRDQE